MSIKFIKALIIEDDPLFQKEIIHALPANIKATVAATFQQAKAEIGNGCFDLFIVDRHLPDGLGINLIPEIKVFNPSSFVMVLTVDGNESSIEEALNQGASDYLIKSKNLRNELPGRIKVAESRIQIERRCLNAENLIKELVDSKIIGSSHSTQELRRAIKTYGSAEINVIITGETGTGKELIANALHAEIKNTNRPYVVLNCGSFTPTLIESELFGHERGAFTGATSSKPGKVEVATGGDLFLDEIGELPIELQSKLLRFLESGEYYRIGSNTLKHAKVRVISATNRDLDKMVEEGKFRQDLLYRINGAEISTTPLRDRNEEIPELVKFFIYKREGARFSIESSALAALQNEEWIGNIRELKNRIECAIALSKADGRSNLKIIDFKLKRQKSHVFRTKDSFRIDTTQLSGRGYHEALLQVEREYLFTALQKHFGDAAKAAKTLDIPIATFYRRIQLCGLSRQKQTSWRSVR